MPTYSNIKEPVLNEQMLLGEIIKRYIHIYGVQKSIGKSNFLLFLMEGIVHETGIVLIEKATENRNS